MKNLLFTLIIFYAAINSEAQNDGKPCKSKCDTVPRTHIEFSLSKPSSAIPKFISSRSQVLFTINDVNTFLYSVKFSEKQKELFSEEDLAKKEQNYDYKLSDFSITELRMADLLIPQVKDQETVMSKNEIESKQRMHKESILKFEQLKSENLLLRKNIIEKDSLLNELEQINKTASAIITESDSIQLTEKEKLQSLKERIEINLKRIQIQIDNSPIENKTLDIVKKNIRDLNDTIDSQMALLKILEDRYNQLVKNDEEDYVLILEYKGKFNQYRKVVSDLNRMILLYNEFLFLLYSNEPFDSINIKKEIVLQEYLGKGATELQIQSKCNKLLQELDDLYYDLSEILTRMRDRNRLNPAFTKLSSFHTSIARDKYGELFRQIIRIYNAINKENWTFEYQTSSISQKTDQIFYALDFTPVTNQYSSTNKAYSYNYNFDIKGGIKIDVSAGLLYHLRLNDQQVRLEKDTDTTTRLIKVKDQNHFIPSVGALFNVYYRSKSSLKPTFNFGVGTNIDKLRYYLGLGLLVGKSERIGINLGAVGGNVKRISDEYKNKIILPGSASNWLNTDFMQSGDTFRIGMYVGVTYNLSGKNNQEMSAMIKK